MSLKTFNSCKFLKINGYTWDEHELSLNKLLVPNDSVKISKNMYKTTFKRTKTEVFNMGCFESGARFMTGD